MFSFRTQLLSACVAILPVAAPALAQESNVKTFDPAFFQRFAPQTALDMVEQIPGFSLRATGGGRGLGQGGTNVLIDGKRVTSKDTDVLDILANTPVRAVARIEVADAATLGVTGLTGQVANVVLQRTELSGSFEYAPEFRQGTKPRFTRGSASLTGTRGRLSYTLGFENESSRGFEEGPETILDGTATVIEERFERVRIETEVPSVTFALDLPLGPRSLLSMRGSAATFSLEQDEFSDRGPNGTRDSLIAEDEWNANLNLEFNRQTGPGNFKLIASQRYEHSPVTSIVDEEGNPAGDVDFRFLQTNDEGESILRTEYGWTSGERSSWEIAAEAAYNFLEDEQSFQINGDLPSSAPQTRVEELRTQASITRGFAIDKLAVQASIAGEWSRIEAERASELREEDFLRPKGLVTLSYPLTERVDLRARFERSVGQLNFFDFVDSNDLTEERPRGGNRNLVPQQAWEGEFEIERNFGADEKVILRIEGQLIEDRVERVPIEIEGLDGSPVLVDGVGNVDGARFASAVIEGTILTDRWKVPGGRFDFLGVRRTSAVEDPLTGEERNFNTLQEWGYDLNFRQDIPGTPVAWGVGAARNGPQTAIRFNEIATFDVGQANVSAFFEHKNVFGMNLRIRASNLANRDYLFDRTIYTGRRDISPIDRVESRTRIDNERFTITLSGNF